MEIITWFTNLMNFIVQLNWVKITEILIPALFSIIAIYIARHLEKQKEIEQEIRVKKIKIYGDITKLIFEDVMGRSKTNKPLTDKQIAEIFPKIANELIFWGSDEVIRQFQLAFNCFRAGDVLVMMEELENLLLAIRKDTGHNNKKLQKFDLIKVFITDLDEAVVTQKAKTTGITNKALN